ncbi:hypothetical protein DID88_002813 [Monilinia fructigena]|uniref:TLC domain-containing protein n=1 Tax=Monilinia fructigena TaxID=38457 RepID=A0A395IN62_9HELO|nr:hypothetical protein DID88_002813 [Monilinia fructigena]
MRLSSEAKSRFEHDDLMDRGRALIEESIKFGVTHMRAFVEVDFGVEMKCLDAGLELKAEFRDKCYIQICVFAQDPIFSHDHGSRSMTDLLENAIQKHGVEVLGSTPYVEKSLELQEENMKWTIETAKLYQLHLDFHLDYHLNEHQKPMVYSAIERLHRINWTTNYEQKEFRTVVFGHCTRLTLLDGNEWHKLRQEIRDLPVSFVGLPTSDLFMMGRPDEATGGSNRVRGTLQVVEMIKKYDFNAAIGINNVGNAFTPQGTCDPMGLTSLGVGIYQAGTKADAQILLECVSTRARQAIGIYVEHNINSNLDIGSPSSFVIFGTKGSRNFRARKSIQELVYDAGFERTTIFEVCYDKKMHDPFPIPPSQWLSQAVQPFADYFHLTTLPLHIHEVLGSFLAYTFINKVVAPQVSIRLFPEKYSKFSAERKLNWDECWHMQLVLSWFFSFGFRPFVNFYGCTFILYELSSPFLNFHWFFDKLDMTGSKPQLYNGIALLFTFFCCRLVWGTYQSLRVYQDVWRSMHNQPSNSASINIDALANGTVSALDAAAGHSATPIHNDIMRFANDEFIPLWLGFTYLGSNLVLNTLNFYWFGKMIEAVRKRFQPAKEGRQKDKAIAMKSTGANGKTRISVKESEIRRRNALDDNEPIAAVS